MTLYLMKNGGQVKHRPARYIFKTLTIFPGTYLTTNSDGVLKITVEPSVDWREFARCLWPIMG